MDYYAYETDAAMDAPGIKPDAGGPPQSDKPRKMPQETLNEFWDGLITKTPGKVFQIFPRSLYSNLMPPVKADGAASRARAPAAYEVAAAECKRKVDRAVRECRRTNEKFTDPDFDIESDMQRNCLSGLSVPGAEPSPSNGPVGSGRLRNALSTLVASKVLGVNSSVSMDVTALQNALEDSDSDSEDDAMYPATVHRVDYIFEDPAFIVDGYSTSDVQQGANGDCWWIAAVATLCSMPELMEKVCVARDAECGVYGFVFYRDGEWISTLVDDNLYMRSDDYDAYGDDYDPTGERERKYRERYQTGSSALYFAKCQSENETWLPLLEKAYAKVHGDYNAIQGGNSGEGVEDMTGGVTSALSTNKILSKDVLWKELLNVNKEFIFAASSPGWGTDREARGGLALNHAYSILKAVEVVGEDDKKVKLVLIRNPWGRRSRNGTGEWTGSWSDGSKEWTPYWMKKLNHRFGDDGEFWMSYTDLCRKFDTLHRTRLFDEDWTIVQQWTSVHVSWVSGYLTTRFVIEVKKAGTVVVVLSQLDSRYFRGLEGQYTFHLHFLLQEEDAEAGDHIVRARGSQWSIPDRSVSAEIELEPGTYEVLPKISATRNLQKAFVEEVVKKAAEDNPQKLRQIGLNYDIAHAKGGFQEEIEEAEREKKKKEEEAKLQKERDAMEAKVRKFEEEMRQREMKEKLELEKEEKARKEKEEAAKQQKVTSEKVPGATADTGEKKGLDKGKKSDDKSTPEEVAEDLPITSGAEARKSTGSEVEGKDQSEHPKEAGKAEEKTEESKASEKESGSEDKGQEKATEPAPVAAAKATEESPNPWNAVAVIGLRVYSMDPELAVKLMKPKGIEEAAVLDVDGVSGAGATM